MSPEELVEIEAIKVLKHRYMRGVDLKDWDLVESCFTDDARARYGGVPDLDGRDAVLEFLRDSLSDEGLVTSHCVSQPEIELLGPDRARGTWLLRDVVIVPAAQLTLRGAAFYEDEYRRVDGRWLLSSTGYRRVYEEVESRRPEPDLRLTATWFGGASGPATGGAAGPGA